MSARGWIKAVGNQKPARAANLGGLVMPIRNSSRVAVAMFSLTFALSPVAAQKKTGDQDPSEKPRNVKPELKKAYKDWLEKDVTYIITDEERKAFKKLETDD